MQSDDKGESLDIIVLGDFSQKEVNTLALALELKKSGRRVNVLSVSDSRIGRPLTFSEDRRLLELISIDLAPMEYPYTPLGAPKTFQSKSERKEMFRNWRHQSKNLRK